MHTGYYETRRLIETETTFALERAKDECFKEIGIKHYRYIAEIDGRTSQVCKSLNGQVFDMKDREIGVNCPPMHPFCRSVTVPEVSKKELKKVEDKGIIEETEPFVDSKNIKEAENYAKNTLGVKNVSYKGVDVTTANEWNRGLKDSFERFPELRNNFGFVGEAHERNKMIKPIAKQHILKELKRLNPSFSIEMLEPYAESNLKVFMKRM